MFVGTITSQGPEFCIVNQDIYVPAFLLKGMKIGPNSFLRVNAVQNPVGRNRWRALDVELLHSMPGDAAIPAMSPVLMPQPLVPVHTHIPSMPRTSEGDGHAGSLGANPSAALQTFCALVTGSVDSFYVVNQNCFVPMHLLSGLPVTINQTMLQVTAMYTNGHWIATQAFPVMSHPAFPL